MITMLIQELYNQDPETLPSDITVSEALAIMEEKDVNGFIVTDKQKRVLGILSLQDIAAATVPYQFQKNYRMAMAMYRKGFFHERAEEIKDKKISEIMRLDFVTVSLRTNIMAIMSDFLKNDLYIVPVVEQGKLIGVVTRSQIREALLIGMNLEKRINHDN